MAVSQTLVSTKGYIKLNNGSSSGKVKTVNGFTFPIDKTKTDAVIGTGMVAITNAAAPIFTKTVYQLLRTNNYDVVDDD